MKTHSFDIYETLFYLHIPKCGGSSFVAHLLDWFAEETAYKVPNNEFFIDDISKIYCTKCIYGHQFFPFTYLLPSPTYVITFLREPVIRTISAYEYISSKKEHIHHSRLLSSVHSIDQFLTDDFFMFHSSNMQTRMLGVEYNIQAIIENVNTGLYSKQKAKELIAKEENAECTSLMLERAKSRLAAMPFFGITELFEKSVIQFANQLNLQLPDNIYQLNPTSSRETEERFTKYSKKEIEAIKYNNQFDIELYKFARQLFQEK